jgi:hypothetical protein
LVLPFPFLTTPLIDLLRSEALISYASIVAVRSAALTGGDYVPKTGFVSEVFSSVGIF